MKTTLAVGAIVIAIIASPFIYAEVTAYRNAPSDLERSVKELRESVDGYKKAADRANSN
jgi:hypothetical protein